LRRLFLKRPGRAAAVGLENAKACLIDKENEFVARAVTYRRLAGRRRRPQKYAEAAAAAMTAVIFNGIHRHGTAVADPMLSRP
jgi:hypothetical protein